MEYKESNVSHTAAQEDVESKGHPRQDLPRPIGNGLSPQATPIQLEEEMEEADGIEAGATPRHSSKTVISFDSTDPEHPNNWPPRKKNFVVFAGMMTVVNSTLGSSLPSGAITYIAEDFDVTNQQQLVLPISVFLIGYVIGPLICGPTSETVGRKPVMLFSFIIYTFFTMTCALAPNWPSFLVFRLICGGMASAPIAVVGGLYADIYNEPRQRGRSLAYFMAGTTFGPCLGPLISGFLSAVSWRWTFWFALIFAGVTVPLLVFIPETYVPILLKRRAEKMRKKTGNLGIVASSELEKKDLRYMVTKVLTRPFRMIIYESIVLFTCLYLSLAYAIFYLYFEAYPFVFQGPKSVYHMSTGISGLAFLPIGVGAGLCAIIFAWWDSYLARAQKRGDRWAMIEEYRRLPLACIGGPMYVVALFWFGWASSPHVHWIVPMLSGVFFGMGFLLIFMAMLNYLTDAYETFAASAQSISSTTRSVFGALLPLAAGPMYSKLGVHWASSLLAFLSLGMAVIPFAFIKYGDGIRANSRFCQYLKEMKERTMREEEERRRSRSRSRKESELTLRGAGGKEVLG